MHIFDFFRDIFSVFGAFSRFLGVKFGFQKSCLCKRNDKYEVWSPADCGQVDLVLMHPFRKKTIDFWSLPSKKRGG